MSIIFFPSEFIIQFKSIQAKQFDLVTLSLTQSCATLIIEARFKNLWEVDLWQV